jgi:uncharacterized tellurite resistance protein B-like protein
MLESIVNYLAYGSLVFAVVSAYLQTNKLWQRKHIPEVADSISIPGIAVEAIPLFFFGIYFLVKGEVVGIIDSAIWLTTTIIFILIGSGAWVRGKRGAGFWSRVGSAVASERKEMGALAKALIQPSAREQLVELLQSLAEVDGEVSERETELIHQFASDWGLSISLEQAQPSSNLSARLLKVSRSLRKYLQTSPPSQQVAHIEELMQILVNADGTCHEDEKIALEELQGLIASYLSDETSTPDYHVLVAPQSQEQIESLTVLMDESAQHDGAGGRGFTVGMFHSRSYAETICQEYRRLGYFTVITDDKLESA